MTETAPTPHADAPAAPYQDAHAAAFSESSEPAYALIGEILHVTDESGATTQQLLVGEGRLRPIDPGLLPVFEFFTTPRAEHQAKEWLEWAGAPSDLLDYLVKLGILVRVDARTSWTGAKSLRGLRLAGQSQPGDQTVDGWLCVVSRTTGETVMTVSPELATLMWGNDEGWDMPAAIKRMAKVSGLDRETVARSALAMMPMLLEYGCARLEWLRVPK